MTHIRLEFEGITVKYPTYRGANQTKEYLISVGSLYCTDSLSYTS